MSRATGDRSRVLGLSARVLPLIRRPADMTEATRWLFAVLAVASLTLSLPAPLSSDNSSMRLVALACAMVLMVSVCAGYLRRTAPLGTDLVDAAGVKMAAQMGMQTIAEGVERLDQQTFLASIGTDAVQGYLYLRPTTAVAFGAWLTTHNASLANTPPVGDVVIPFVPRQSA